MPSSCNTSGTGMGLHRAKSLPAHRQASPPPAQVEVVPEDLLMGLSLSQSACAKSRNRAMTASDFDSILAQL